MSASSTSRYREPSTIKLVIDPYRRVYIKVHNDKPVYVLNLVRAQTFRRASKYKFIHHGDMGKKTIYVVKNGVVKTLEENK